MTDAYFNSLQNDKINLAQFALMAAQPGLRANVLMLQNVGELWCWMLTESHRISYTPGAFCELIYVFIALDTIWRFQWL